MLIEHEITTAHSLETLQEKLAALPGWVWKRSESDYLGDHLVGRDETRGFRMDVLPNGKPGGYDVSIESNDATQKELAETVLEGILQEI